MRMGQNPRFQHDCDHCIFIEYAEDFSAYGTPIRGGDLYVCSQGGGMPTIVVRMSSRPEDYTTHHLNDLIQAFWKLLIKNEKTKAAH